MLIKRLEWIHPLKVAENIPDDVDNYVLLYSGMDTAYTGNYSFLGIDKLDEVMVGGWSSLADKLTSDKQLPLENAWFGYLGYGLKNELENLDGDTPSIIDSPDLCFTRFRFILLFDHLNQHVELWGENSDDRSLTKIYNIITNAKGDNLAEPANVFVHLASVGSNMTRKEYLQNVDFIKKSIERGDLYQANLTRKFYGKFTGQVSGLDIFKRLCKLSPAPYSAFIKTANVQVISSSPERFLRIDNYGKVNTRPIKGSAARFNDAPQDAAARDRLQFSEKNRAENLMIVDLCRNDLSKHCSPGSVKVEELFGIETYATVHHMVSSVSGIKTSDSSTLTLIKGCFPPGSMTGTPKIKAMQVCSQLEKLRRGIYSGAIGWFGGDGSADLSVVIRTIVTQGDKFEFQVGGAIVNDSDPVDEFQETMVKAKAVAAALGIEVSTLESL